MNENDFEKAVAEITERDSRFAPAAYVFVSGALTETARRLGRSRKSPVKQRHISGQELAEGAADFAEEQFGSLAYSVLREWGVKTTRDIGDIVFNLIDVGIFSKTEEDSIDDFDNVFDLRSRLLKK
ncbi:MAG: hypothetical protein IJN19_02195 [Opitutales bacterium]|nr:hypothetical protein [Opitutales bacterium]